MRVRLVVATLLVAGAGVVYSAPVGAASRVDPYFVDITCPSATSCFAVGNLLAPNGTTTTLIEHWNGKTWSITASPNLANPSQTGGSYLHDVACASPSSCFAVGYSATRKGVRLPGRPFVEHWNGKQWTIVASANPRGAAYAELDSISCVAGNKCFAVGWFYADASTARARPLAERWNGNGFSIVPSEMPQGTLDARLFGVKCRTAADCVAVGPSYGPEIVEHWNGAAWSIAAELDAPSEFAELDSVSCPTATRCIAVGSYDEAANAKAMIFAGSGRNWSQLASDNPKGIRQSRLLDVACPTPTGCVAVGVTDQGVQTAQSTFVEHSVGDVWSRVASPNPDRRPDAANVLAGVACPTTKSCFAVGDTTSGVSPTSLILHWNGASWTVAAHPKPK